MLQVKTQGYRLVWAQELDVRSLYHPYTCRFKSKSSQFHYRLTIFGVPCATLRYLVVFSMTGWIEVPPISVIMVHCGTVCIVSGWLYIRFGGKKKKRKKQITANHFDFNNFTRIEKYVKLMLTLAFRERAVPVQLAWWLESQELVILIWGCMPYEEIDSLFSWIRVVSSKLRSWVNSATGASIYLSILRYILTPEGDVRRVFRNTKCWGG